MGATLGLDELIVPVQAQESGRLASLENRIRELASGLATRSTPEKLGDSTSHTRRDVAGIGAREDGWSGRG